ncbi:MAG: hypothetical protein COA91_13830 [Robiginitomaculum sp.]|nr:MAG: hypothetical protein COA91_13830 [Robiginitomaculum sp.]
MAVKKTPDGRIVEEKTKPISYGRGRKANPMPSNVGGSKTVLSSNNPGGSRGSGGDALDDKTRIVGSRGANAQQNSGNKNALDADTRMAGAPRSNSSSDTYPTELVDGRHDKTIKAEADGGKTQLVRPGSNLGDKNKDVDICEDPVVGWLVIEEGPGQGFSMPLGVGMNSVGRGTDQRVSAAYGDNALSSKKHFLVSYDPRSCDFGVHRGDGSNLTYLNGSPVYSSELLKNFDQIEAGATKFRFVKFCGKKFNWTES